MNDKDTHEIKFKKPVRNDGKIKCDYCNARFETKTILYSHMAYEHSEKIRKVTKRLKVALAVSLTFASVCIGYVMGLLL